MLSHGPFAERFLEMPRSLKRARRERFTAAVTFEGRWAVDENARLAATRDELLPLLMSGKITVKDAEKTVEEVV